MHLTIAVLSLTSFAASLLAQTSDGGADRLLSTSLAATAKAMEASIARNLTEAAEAMPAESSDFKPTPEIRTFAQLIGHVSDVNYFFCSQAKGAAYPSKTSTSARTAKDAMLRALKDSLAYCDNVYADLTDANFGDHVTLAGFGNKPTQTTRGQVLIFNTTHNNEHYGNIVLYLRLKGITPPSTARGRK
jgi:uncharacterized damage-inducible protein DinB